MAPRHLLLGIILLGHPIWGNLKTITGAFQGHQGNDQLRQSPSLPEYKAWNNTMTTKTVKRTNPPKGAHGAETKEEKNNTKGHGTEKIT